MVIHWPGNVQNSRDERKWPLIKNRCSRSDDAVTFTTEYGRDGASIFQQQMAHTVS